MAIVVVENISWTISASKSFDKIIQYLKENWSDKEISNFILRTNNLISMLTQHPEMCRPSQKRKHVRIAFLNKQTQMVYHYKPRKSEIVILLFWHPKRNPSKFKF